MISQSIDARRRMIECSNENISIQRQCELIGLSPSTYYYTPGSESEENLLYMRLMDEQYLKCPYYGVGQMTYYLRNAGYKVNPKRVRRLLRKMGLTAMCPGPHTSNPGKGADYQVFPYLLRGMKIGQVGQVVGADITYIPMPKGFLYLVAFIDWYSRYVLSWELSNSLESSFCIEALSRIWTQTNVEILNTDQGSQFTSNKFVNSVLSHEGTRLSMDGKGRAIDNVFTERLWRNVKYEEVYIKEYLDGRHAYESIEEYLRFYNCERPNKNLGGKPPIDVFSGKISVPAIKISKF